MLWITNLKPIKSINSVLQPLGLTVSNIEEMISELARGTLATLTIYIMFSTVEAQSQRCVNQDINIQNCKDDCLERFSRRDILLNCLRGCVARYRTNDCRLSSD